MPGRARSQSSPWPSGSSDEIPADRTRWSRSVELGERNQRALRSILESASSQPSSDPVVQAVGTFYGACVDETARETAGTTGIDPLLKTVRSVRDLPSLVAAVAELHGKLTLGENIADIGVLKLAFRAYRALRNGAGPRVVADGFNDDQQFFLSYGQSQCTKWREERMRTLLQTDTHSPHKFQVNGSVSNTPEFASAFSCPVGKTLNPETRCDVW